MLVVCIITNMMQAGSGSTDAGDLCAEVEEGRIKSRGVCLQKVSSADVRLLRNRMLAHCLSGARGAGKAGSVRTEPILSFCGCEMPHVANLDSGISDHPLWPLFSSSQNFPGPVTLPANRHPMPTMAMGMSGEVMFATVPVMGREQSCR